MRSLSWIGMGLVLFSVQGLQAKELSVIPVPSYSDGVRYWDSGDYIAARNEWYRCVVLEEYGMGNHPGCDAESSGESLVEAESELHFQNVPTASPARAATEAPFPRVSAQVRQEEPDPVKLARYARHFEAEARLAKTRGQLDAALRLYRAAQRMDPGSRVLAQEIKGLEAEVN